MKRKYRENIMICYVLFKYAAIFSDLLRVYSFTFVEFLLFSYILFCTALFSSILLLQFIILLYYINCAVLCIIFSARHSYVLFHSCIFNIIIIYVYFISILHRAMLQAVVHRPLPTEILFSLRPINVGFVVYKLALGQVWLRVLFTHTFIYQIHYIISALREPLNKEIQNKNEHSFCRALFLLAEDVWEIQPIFQIIQHIVLWMHCDVNLHTGLDILLGYWFTLINYA
jgi:hypothetical protein